MAGYTDKASVVSRDSTSFPRKSERSRTSVTEEPEKHSESSYAHLWTRDELAETFTFLNFDLTWMFAATLASVILYVMFTYLMVFAGDHVMTTLELIVAVICSAVVITDVASTILHLSWTTVASLRDITPLNRGLVTLDVVSLVSLLHPVLPPLKPVQYVLLCMECFRMYRVFRFFYTLSRTVDINTVSTLLKKYILLFVVFVHSFACVWQLVGCYKCGYTDWTLTAEANTYITDYSPSDWYILCLYYTLTIITTVGFGDIHGYTIVERGLTIAIMLIGYSFFTATFLGSWTAVQVEHYRRHAQFHNRLGLIKRCTTHHHIPPEMSRKIYQFYLAFWYQKGAIRSSVLFNTLPRSLRQEVLVDCYWFFLQQSFFLKYASDAFKRAVALDIETKILMDGEKVYEQGKEINTVVYVSSGSLRIHSAQDNESTILTLGIGTLLGENCLVCGCKSPVKVTASGFCVLQVLQKRHFWRTANKYTRLRQVKQLHQNFRIKINHAINSENEKRAITKVSGGDSIQALKVVKGLLQVEKPKTGEGYFHRIENTEETRIYSDLYTLSRAETELKNSDDIFARTTWPWTLRPTSSFLTIWEYIIVATVLFVALLYPYKFAFGHIEEELTETAIAIDTIYILDIILQTCTAVEFDNVIFSEVPDIFLLRMRQPSYIVDLLAAVPLDQVARTLQVSDDSNVISLLSARRLLKIQRAVIFVNNLGTQFEFNIALVRCIKYVLYLWMSAYFMGAFYYLLACYGGECRPRTWWAQLLAIDGETGVRYKYPFEVSMYFAVLVLSQTGYGDISATNKVEMHVMLAFFVVGTLTFSYLVADYSATVMLRSRASTLYQETVMVIRTFLMGNHIVPSVQSRLNSFLLLQWDQDKGYRLMKNKSFLYDCPENLYTSMVTSKYYHMLHRIPLFQEVRQDFIAAVCVACQPLLLPPHEMVIYGGETAKEMFVIEKGKCVVISAVSGKIEKILGPNSDFCVLEMLLAQPALYNVQTVTHVELIRISCEDFKEVLKKFPQVATDIEIAVKETTKQLAVSRLFIRRSAVTYRAISEEQTSSWYVFPKKKLHPRNIDYIWGFRKPGFANIFRLLLLRRTIIPNGNFIMFWEIGRAISAFLTGMTYPEAVYMSALYPNFSHYLKVFDVLAVLDIYVRFHVSYYNKRGILVTHPKYTALNYLSRAFILDLLGAFPLGNMLSLFVKINYKDRYSVRNYYKQLSMLSLNKLLQMYRVPDAFAYFQRDPMKRQGVLFNVFRFLPITLVFLNFLACVMLTMTTEMVYDTPHKLTIKFLNTTWLSHLITENPQLANQAFDVYFVTYYWVTQTCLLTGFGDVIAEHNSEMYFVLFSIIAGYLLFTYVLVIISSSIVNVNSNLTTYQEYMKHLITYMRKEQIKPALRQKAIDHFEYLWKRTHGLDTTQILQKCHRALRQDCALSLYEQTMMEMPIFRDLGRTFFRLFATHLREAYFLKGDPIIKLNDIVSTLYIVHKGEVLVKGPEGSTFAVLTRGCIFGNIDDIASTRSMVTVIADSSVDLLTVDTLNMYSIASEYPALKSRMIRHILSENLSFVAKSRTNADFSVSIAKDDPRENPSQAELQDKIRNFLLNERIKFICMLFAFASCLIVFYHMSFQEHTLVVFLLTYTFDVFHVVKICMSFFMPYKNHEGQIVTGRKMIRKRYMSSYCFYCDLFAVVPFEVFVLAAPNGERLFYLSVLRLNKMLKTVEIYAYFNISYDDLNVNVLKHKLGAVAMFLFLMLHVGTCVLYLIGCPGTVCAKNHWTFDREGNRTCGNSYYFCSFYFMTAITTSTGIGDLVPRHTSEMIVVTIMMICIKFVVAVFLGEISALVQNNTYFLVNYDHGMLKLRGFLKNNDASRPLIKRILDYSSQLWKMQRGHQLPLLLENAPMFLKEEIKVAAYGHHLYEVNHKNHIFVSCHPDFLRVLISRLVVQTFFAGNTICPQGDINNCMYFIHKGKVDVLSMEQNVEVLVDVLYERDCFGVVQGLYFKTPHTHSFKAATGCVILSLELRRWVGMLHYFPSARYEIYERVMHVI